MKAENKTLKEKRTGVLRQIDEFDPQVVKSDEKNYSVYLSKKCRDTLDGLLKKSVVE